jgi:RNA polymerase sigma factor (sigma-70 family)
LDEPFDRVLDAARANAPWAYRRLYESLAGPVSGYLRGQGARDVEDLTSEVFLGVFRRLGTFEGDEAAFRSWVFTIAHRRLTDERRSRARRPEPASLDERPGEVVGGDVEQEVLDRLGAEGVHRLLDRLSDDQRDVLLLRVVGDLTVDQVAEATGKRPGAVKALQRRGLNALRKIIADEGVPL